MTYEERERIFSKDVISLDEFAKVMDMDKSTASITMNDIKKSLKRPRVTQRGKLHIQDYIDYYRLDIRRYLKNED